MGFKDFIKNWRSGYWIFFVLIIFMFIMFIYSITNTTSSEVAFRQGEAIFDICVGLFIIWLGARSFFKKSLDEKNIESLKLI